MITPDTKNGPISFESCRKARVARDGRYDGLIYSGATTTKVYCRPNCPGKPPLVSNSIFFLHKAQAEAAGFRPCLRCRPELAPGNLIRNAARWEIRHALDRIRRGMHAGLVINPGDTKETVARISTKFYDVVGTTIPNYVNTFRLGFAKMLMTDTALPLSDINSMLGFDTTRDMLAALSGLYHRDPISFRKPLPLKTHPGIQSCAVMLSYRPPFDWSGLMAYLKGRAITGVEKVDGPLYRRSFDLDGHRGWLSLENAPQRHAVRLEVHAPDLKCMAQVVWRVRRMLDLDADPMRLAAHFDKDPLMGEAWLKYPGIRVPVAWDAFEFAVRAIVGQVVSVGVATTLIGKIAATFSKERVSQAPKGVETIFPKPADLLGADLRSCGLTRTKAAAIAALAGEVVHGNLELQTATDLDTFVRKCTAIKGIGEWTAQTMAMRGLGDADAFPAGDLGIVKALSAGGQAMKPARVERMAAGWRPWRAYAAMLLWRMNTK